MTTAEENLTIKIEPPEIPKASWLIRKCVAGVSKDEVLTTITDIDLFIEILQSNLEALETYKKVLLNRAIAENIKEDYGAILIEIPGKKMRNPINNIEMFAAHFPDGYKSIRNQQRLNLDDAYRKDVAFLDVSAIPLTIADLKIGKDVITEFTGYKPQEIKIVVQRKQGMKNELIT